MKKRLLSMILCLCAIMQMFAPIGVAAQGSDAFDDYDKYSLDLTYALTYSALSSEMLTLKEFNVCVPLETNADILQLNDGSGPILLDTYSNDALVDTEIMNIELENNLAIAGEAYDSLMKTFYNAQPDSQKHNPDIYTVGGISAEGFPRTFAGAYINKNLDLVVLMTEDTIQTKATLAYAEDTILQATGTDQLIFSTAEFSYSDLVSLMSCSYKSISIGTIFIFSCSKPYRSIVQWSRR